MTIPTVTALIDALDASHLLPAEQSNELPRLRDRFADPRSLAKELMERGWLTSYQVNQLFRGRTHELVLGQYVLLERLGEGGVGQVFKARHQIMGRIVALKVIRPELLKDPETVDRFQREIRVVSQLTHPNVVHAFDAGPIGANFFLAMEFVEGTDLARMVVQRGKLPCAEACEYIRQAALGLQHIHERGLVHRDIKPHNLLLSKSHGPQPVSLIKILDLGLAVLQRPVDRDAGRGVTAAGTLMGTVDYMAPEQALDFRQVDSRADIYSLGCTSYHLLAGRPPFPDGTAAQLLRHQQAEPPPVEQFQPTLPAHVAALIRKMMVKRPDDRYQSAADVLAVLNGSRPAIAPVPLSVDTRLTTAEHVGDGRPTPAPGPMAPLAVLVTSTTNRPAPAAIPLLPPANGTPISRGRASIVTKPWQRFGRKGLAVTLAMGLALLVLLLVLWPRGRKPSPPPERLPSAEETTDADLVRLKQRFGDYAADPEPLRRYLLAVRRVHAADPRSLQAAELLTQLASPLDKLDGQNISAEDRAYTSSLDGLVAVFGEQRMRHWGKSRCVTFSQDGKLVASGGDDSTVRLWDAATGKQLRALPHAGAVAWVSFVPGTNRIATLEGASIKCWDSTTGKDLSAPAGRYLGVSADGKLAATAVDSQVKIWQLATGQERGAFPAPRLVWCVAFSADGQLAASSGDDLTISVWETATGKLRSSLKGLAKHVIRLQFAAGDKTLASWENETKNLKLWDVATEKEIVTFAAVHIWDLAPDGKTAAIFLDGQFRIWDMALKKERAAIKHGGWQYGLFFSPDSQLIATTISDGNGTVKFWDVATGTERVTLAGNPGAYPALAYTADGKSLATANREGAVRLWDLTNGSERLPGPSRSDWFSTGRFSHDGQTLALVSGNVIKLCDTAQGKERATVAGHSAAIASLDFAPDDQLLATGGHDGHVKLWNVASGGILLTLTPGHANTSLAFTPDGKGLFSASETVARLWDPSTGQQRASFQRGKEFGVSVIALTANGKTLAVGHHDSTLSLWDVGSAKMRTSFPVGKNIITKVAFSPDGKLVAAKSLDDGLIKIWDVEANKERATLPPLTAAWALAPDGRTLTVGFQNGRLQTFDSSTGKVKLPLEEQPRPVNSVVYSPDGKLIATAGTDGRVILWDPTSAKRKVREWQLPGVVNQVGFAPDGRHLFTINGNGTAYVLRLQPPQFRAGP